MGRHELAIFLVFNFLGVGVLSAPILATYVIRWFEFSGPHAYSRAVIVIIITVCFLSLCVNAAIKKYLKITGARR